MSYKILVFELYCFDKDGELNAEQTNKLNGLGKQGYKIISTSSTSHADDVYILTVVLEKPD